MRGIGRSVLAVLLGLVVGFVVLVVLEALAHLLYPLSAVLDMNHPEVLKAAMDNVPVRVLLLVLFAQTFGPFVGAWTAARIARERPLFHGLIVGGVFLCGSIMNMLIIPHPAWFAIASVPAPVVAAFVGSKLAARDSRPGHKSSLPANEITLGEV